MKPDIEQMLRDLTDTGLPLSVANMIRVGDIEDRIKAGEAALCLLGVENLAKVALGLVSDLAVALKGSPNLSERVDALLPSSTKVLKLYLVIAEYPKTESRDGTS